MKFISKAAAVVSSSLVLALAIALPASAHVTVKPAEVLTGAYQTFAVSAPNEKDMAYTKIKLDIPEGVASVMPNAKSGWNITLEKIGEGETATVKSITWEGSVASGFREEFAFSAKTPDNAGSIEWKAYQTYEDGTTVAWDQKTESEEEGDTSGPLSVTKVLAESATDAAVTAAADEASSAKQTAQLALALSIAGLIASLFLIVRSFKK